jgi:hypothetical protein
MPDSPEHVPVIAVASGKGGVGKTTVAVNLALALTDRGCRTGLIDADLYGPDVPRMMGLRRKTETSGVTLFARPGAPGSRLETVSRHGVQLASAAFLLGENQALAIDGSVAQLLVRRLISDSAWDHLDYLVTCRRGRRTSSSSRSPCPAVRCAYWSWLPRRSSPTRTPGGWWRTCNSAAPGRGPPSTWRGWRT